MGKETNGQIKCVEDHHELKNGVVWKEMKEGVKELLERNCLRVRMNGLKMIQKVMKSNWFNEGKGTP